MRLIRDGEKGGGGLWRWGKREIIYLSLHCHYQNGSCIKMSSYESHFNVLLTVRDKVTRQCPQTTTFLKRKETRSGIEPRPFCLPAQRLTARPNRLTFFKFVFTSSSWLKCCFTSTETVGFLGTGAQDVHIYFHTAPELCF